MELANPEQICTNGTLCAESRTIELGEGDTLFSANGSGAAGANGLATLTVACFPDAGIWRLDILARLHIDSEEHLWDRLLSDY